jgi:hypothetical protein
MHGKSKHTSYKYVACFVYHYLRPVMVKSPALVDMKYALYSTALIPNILSFCQ